MRHMKLIHKSIPQEFLNHLPKGIKYVMKNGKDFLVVEQVFCPEGHSLMVDHVHLHNEVSIKVIARIGNNEGKVFLDAFWGSHDKLYSFIPKKKELSKKNDILCPVCNCSLIVKREIPCEMCGETKFIVLCLPGSYNRIELCAKLGCPEHHLIVHDVSERVSEIVSDINYFGL